MDILSCYLTPVYILTPFPATGSLKYFNWPWLGKKLLNGSYEYILTSIALPFLLI